MTERPKCIKCGDAISPIVVEWFHKQKTDKGEKARDPKVCGACVYDAIMNFPDEPESKP